MGSTTKTVTLPTEKTLVNQASNKPEVQEALQKAKELNEAMKALKTEIDKKEYKLKQIVNMLMLIVVFKQITILHSTEVLKSLQLLNHLSLIKT
ncbi:hypothetical protein V2J33_12125 [Staphylococcus saccharolyticus]|uniref:hypothetical protein n=1 Tax=Staphylococcus saccharolyticus TaxID=33028 RepID=UPI001EF02E9D|nr:hypothetical protein [Staphylococcus saccharolyticus]